MDYRSSGVDIDAGAEVVRRIRELAAATRTPGVLADVGAFGGVFALPDAGPDTPLLVASADGVGTKLKVAFLAGRHGTIGEDLVNHCVNDVLVQGARPLFFLDYLATGRLAPDVAVEIVGGLARGCSANGCALLGGETAEMPGFYADGEYDLAGFIVGAVSRSRLVDGTTIGPGDVLIGLPSSGLHTNGYSLARRIVFDGLGLGVGDELAGVGRVGDVLLRPHRSYLHVIAPLLDVEVVKGMAHITGGGLPENLPRTLPDGLGARIDPHAWDVPPLFRVLQAAGGVSTDEMFRTFNMGIGFVVICGSDRQDEVMGRLAASGEAAWIIGRIEPARGVVLAP